MCFLKVGVTVVSMTIKKIFPLVRTLSLTTELGENGRRGVNLSGILIVTKGLWNCISVCLFLMHSQKWTAIALNCRLGDRFWSSSASWKGQCEAGAVQQKFISPDELPVFLASSAASGACSKTCLKCDSSLSEVGSRWLGWMALIRPPYPLLSTIWPGYFRQDALILDETKLTLVIDVD